MASPNGEKIPHSDLIISQRARHINEKDDFLGSYAYKAGINPYHPINNPHGIINMGTAVNRLMEEELQSRLRKDDALQYDRQFQHYYELYGMHQLRTAIAHFLKRHLCPERDINPEHVVVLNGVASCLDALGHAICDPGDVLITPTPVYTRVFTDFCERARVDVQPLSTTEETDDEGNAFSFTPETLEKRIQELIAEGKTVKGFILVHPQNPLGNFFSKSCLQEILQVCSRHELHVVVDEIYALSVFQDEEDFVSTLALHPGPDPQKLHFVWGLTKDFGLAGLRVGVIHSINDHVVKCLRRISTYQCTPSVIHHATTTILNDKEWCDNFFLPTNRKRLRDSYQMTRSHLEEMGFKVFNTKAGFFVWVNAQAFMSTNTKEAEIELFNEIFESGVYIVPGSQLYCVSPGWFRMIFSVNHQDLQHGLKKIKTVVEKKRKLTNRL